MRRLFSTFARGAPGAGLLLIRLAAGLGLVVPAIQALRAAAPLAVAWAEILRVILGILLALGLWTPVVGALVTLSSFSNALRSTSPCHWLMLSALGTALALTGPGAWSVDAHLFGWKRLKIPSADAP